MFTRCVGADELLKEENDENNDSSIKVLDTQY